MSALAPFSDVGRNVPMTILDSSDNVVIADTVYFNVNSFHSVADVRAAVVSAVLAYCTLNSITLTADSIFFEEASIEPLPMRVSGVAKNGCYPIVAAPTVAGGAGVARFYIDSNGDGTGTAPSAVYTASLQAVVVNSTASYLPQSITVDTNRKYIDVKMGQLATGLAGIIPILTGAVANAANGTVVNCLVFVQA